MIDIQKIIGSAGACVEEVEGKYFYYQPIFQSIIKGKNVDILAIYMNVSIPTIYSILKGSKPDYGKMILFIHYGLRVAQCIKPTLVTYEDFLLTKNK